MENVWQLFVIVFVVRETIVAAPQQMVLMASPKLSTAKFNLNWTPRSMWQAMPARHITPINSAVNNNNIADGNDGKDGVTSGGVSYVIIHHTATRSCNNSTTCSAILRTIQRTHQRDRKWDDIGYNFLIGGIGKNIEIYEGRGFNVTGAHTLGFNSKSVGIALIGDWTDTPPPKGMLNKLKKLINYGVNAGYIQQDYKLLAHPQINPTLCPGRKLYFELKRFPHYHELK